jgi:hypothetical protein
MVASSLSTAGVEAIAARRTCEVAQACHNALPTKKRVTSVTSAINRTYRKA